VAESIWEQPVKAEQIDQALFQKFVTEDERLFYGTIRTVSSQIMLLMNLMESWLRSRCWR